MLSDNEQVAALIPHGARGRVRVLCPFCSGSRKKSRDRDLSIEVETGYWKCQHCDRKGRLPQQGVRVMTPPQRTYARPADDDLLPLTITGRAERFFRDRHLDIEFLKLAGVRGNDEVIQYPYYRDGVLINIKERRPPKRFSQVKNAEPIMYGLDWCRDDEIPNLVIVEGEMDALCVRAAGHRHVLSIPNGANQMPTSYLASAQEIIDRAGIITLAVDADQEGARLEQNLANALGRGRCYRVAWPDGIKDANDAMVNLGSDELLRLLVDAIPFPVEGIIKPGAIRGDLFLLYDDNVPGGYSTGWDLFDHLYTVKGGQLTVVTGPPGSGKSEWVDALMVNLATSQGQRFAVYSPEYFPPERYAQKWLEKYSGLPFNDGPSPRIPRDQLDGFIDWVDDRLSILLPRQPRTDEILELVRVQKLREDIAGLVIDPYAYLDKTRPSHMTETDFVGWLLQTLLDAARSYGIHIWVVAHPSKPWGGPPEDGVWIVRPSEISGSAHWFNMPDNIISIGRDKKDETKPVQVHVQKIRYREVGSLGMGEFTFDRITGRYTCDLVRLANGKEFTNDRHPRLSYFSRAL